MSPRDVQKEILTKIEESWDDIEVFVVLAPVAAGKSLVADTVAKWSGKGCSIITPDNLLVHQYLDTFDLRTVRLKNQYRNQAAYNIDKWKLRGSSCVMNYYTYMANRAYNPVLVVDEAHHLVDHLKGTTKLWKHLYNIPDVYHTDELLEWLEGPHKLPVARQQKLDKVKDLLAKAPDRYILELGVDTYRGQQRELLKIIDLVPRDNPPIYWPPSRVKKIVLMSATFSEEDLWALGLDRYKYKIIDVGSPIPPENRPVVYRPVANMRASDWKESAQAVIDWAKKTAELRPGQRGLLHTTYGMARHLQRAAEGDERFMFHSRWNKEEQLTRWLKSDKILVGCGLTTGLSLDDDLCRWQAIVNIPFPNIGDRAIRANLEHRPESYYWAAIRHILQASGRVCRGPDDWGDTVILDSRFPTLYKEHKHLFPQWFNESLKGELNG